MSPISEVVPDRGQLVVVTGPMFSGKTQRLVSLLRIAERAGRTTAAFKPGIDARGDPAHLVSHTGDRHDATVVEDSAALRALAGGADFVAVDEAQFFDAPLVAEIDRLRRHGATVVAAGLDRDFRALPFGPMPALVAAADRVELLTATCGRCGESATLSQRLLGGAPAPWDDDTVRIGSHELYEPRCARCFEPPARAASA